MEDVVVLKKKIIQEFNTLLSKIQNGYKLDYEFILEEISLIDLLKDYKINDQLILPVLQYYINNTWQKTLS